MRRRDLEHIIRSAGAIAESAELIVLGSQAILATHPEAPAELLVSQEVDVYPRDDPTKADLIDGSIGELSLFHEQFGYYAHGVGPETATLPPDWESRLVPVQNENTAGVRGLCLHPTDLAVSKLVAGREKDRQFVHDMLKYQLVSEDELVERTSGLERDLASRAVLVLERCRPS